MTTEGKYRNKIEINAIANKGKSKFSVFILGEIDLNKPLRQDH